MKEKLIQQIKGLTRLTPTYRRAWRRQIECDGLCDVSAKSADREGSALAFDALAETTPEGRAKAEEAVERAVRHAIKRVPYYRGYAEMIADGFDLKKLPILRKADIMGHEEEMVSRRVAKRFTHKKKTGGSTGHSLKLYYSIPTVLKKDVVTDYATALIGKNLKYAVIRGYVPADDKIAEVLRPDYMIMSSYKLSAENLDAYLEAMKEHGSTCIMAYPSSLVILARLIRAKYGTSPLKELKGIMTSSEIFDLDSRRMVSEVFPGVTLVDLYGHNELVVRAISVNNSPYRFFNGYGYTEFIPTGETVNGHRVAEIVGTSVMNRAMPFLRYGTEDYVELDDEGRPIAILGRSCDFVVNRRGEIVPCIVLLRNESKVNMTNFQFYQPEAGRLVFRIVVRPAFSDEEKRMMTDDLTKAFPEMDCEVVVVDAIPRTKIGKQLRLVQDVDLNKYK